VVDGAAAVRADAQAGSRWHTFALRGVQARVAGNASHGSSSSRVSGGGTTVRLPNELVGSRLASENPRELAARFRHALEQLPQLLERGRATRTNFRENTRPKMVVWMVDLIQAHPE
jgi:hypothetical protein